MVMYDFKLKENIFWYGKNYSFCIFYALAAEQKQAIEIQKKERKKKQVSPWCPGIQ